VNEWIFQQPKQMLSDNLGEEEEIGIEKLKISRQKLFIKFIYKTAVLHLMPSLLHHVRKQFKGRHKNQVIYFFVLLQFAWGDC
jgi:hypothetical protein